MDSSNVELKVDGNILTIQVDLSKRFGETRIGKGYIVASTHGWERVSPTVSLNLNVIESKRKLQQ